MHRFIIGPLITLAALAALPAGLSAQEPSTPDAFREAIEEAHGMTAWATHDALRMDANVIFGSNRFSAVFTFETTGPRVRMERADGVTVIYDGHEAWMTPAPDGEPDPRLRFHALTWPWFAASPFSMRGSTLTQPQHLPLTDGTSTPVARQTFDADDGDTPDDWYWLYRDPESDRLIAQAYIVTFGRSVEAAEEEPHAIVYHDFVDVSGTTLSRHWTFHMWSLDNGIEEDELGEVIVERYEYVTPDDDAFTVPDNAVRIPMPGQ